MLPTKRCQLPSLRSHNCQHRAEQLRLHSHRTIARRAAATMRCSPTPTKPNRASLLRRGAAARWKNSACSPGYRLSSSVPYKSHEPAEFSKSCKQFKEGPVNATKSRNPVSCSVLPLTSRSKNWLSSPYFARTGADILHVQPQDLVSNRRRHNFEMRQQDKCGLEP